MASTQLTTLRALLASGTLRPAQAAAVAQVIAPVLGQVAA